MRTSNHRSPARLVCAVTGLACCVLFAAHAVLAALALLNLGVPHLPASLTNAATVLAIAHTLTCIATSYSMLTDAIRPPSSRKKRHLALKWFSGALLAACVAVHVLSATGRIVLGTSAGLAPLLLAMLATAIALYAHSHIGAKSLTRDLGLPKTLRDPFRIACALVLAPSVITLLYLLATSL